MPIPDVSGWLHDVRDLPADYRRAGPPERRADGVTPAEHAAPASKPTYSPRKRAIEDAYAELFRAAEDVRNARLIEHVDDAHLEHALGVLVEVFERLEALL